MPAVNRRHYTGDYEARSKLVRAAAKANAATKCWRCGLTLAQVRAKFPKRRVFWTAGHTIDGDPHCALLAECSVCNFSAGQTLSMQRRRTSGGTGRV